jgi:hypothetical protein
VKKVPLGLLRSRGDLGGPSRPTPPVLAAPPPAPCRHLSGCRRSARPQGWRWQGFHLPPPLLSFPPLVLTFVVVISFMAAMPVLASCAQILPWGVRIRTLGGRICSLRPLRIGGVRWQLLLGGNGVGARLVAWAGCGTGPCLFTAAWPGRFSWRAPRSPRRCRRLVPTWVASAPSRVATSAFAPAAVSEPAPAVVRAMWTTRRPAAGGLQGTVQHGDMVVRPTTAVARACANGIVVVLLAAVVRGSPAAPWWRGCGAGHFVAPQ